MNFNKGIHHASRLGQYVAGPVYHRNVHSWKMSSARTRKQVKDAGHGIASAGGADHRSTENIFLFYPNIIGALESRVFYVPTANMLYVQGILELFLLSLLSTICRYIQGPVLFYTAFHACLML